MHAFVERIVTDRWTGVFCEEDEVNTPTKEDVERAIDRLDAKVFTLLSLYGKNDCYLSIGGGDGRYVVYVSASDQRLWNLITEAESDASVVMLNAGGQVGDFPSRQILEKHRAKKAALTFFMSGHMDGDLSWESQT